MGTASKQGSCSVNLVRVAVRSILCFSKSIGFGIQRIREDWGWFRKVLPPAILAISAISFKKVHKKVDSFPLYRYNGYVRITKQPKRDRNMATALRDEMRFWGGISLSKIAAQLGLTNEYVYMCLRGTRTSARVSSAVLMAIKERKAQLRERLLIDEETNG